MNEFATATEAENPALRREMLEAHRVAQRQQVRMEVVQMILRAEHSLQMTTAEVVAAATTIEAFVVGDEAHPSAHEPKSPDGINVDVAKRRDLLTAARAIEDGLLAAGVSLIDQPHGTVWQQRDVPVWGSVSRSSGAGQA